MVKYISTSYEYKLCWDASRPPTPIQSPQVFIFPTFFNHFGGLAGAPQCVPPQRKYNFPFFIDHRFGTNFRLALSTTGVHIVARFGTATGVAHFGELCLHRASLSGRQAHGHRTNSLFGPSLSVTLELICPYVTEAKAT